MAIELNGQTFTTLSDELYLNGKRIVAAHVDGTRVYPDTTDRMAKMHGSFSYDATHTHFGDADGSPVIGSVSNYLNCSFTGTFYTDGVVRDTLTLPAGYFGWDVQSEGFDVRTYDYMEPYGYKYVAAPPYYPSAPIGKNDTEYEFNRYRIGDTIYFDKLAVDIDMSVPQFCQPVRVINSSRNMFGKATCRFVTDFMSTLNGHYEINSNDWFYWDGWRSAALKIGENVGYGIEIALIAFDSSLLTYAIRFAATVEMTVNWEYSVSGGTVRPISSTETEQYLYAFDGHVKSEYASFTMPITDVEILT